MEEFLRLENICKEFPGVKALDNVSFDLKKGEIHALVGENGAGKSTLIKVLTGAHAPTRGKIHVWGNEYDRMDPILSQKLGIVAVYQELVLANDISVVDNVFLGIEPSKFGFIKRSEKKKKTIELLESIGYNGLDVNATVRSLSTAQQGVVAILRALVRNAKIIIFDEPTASLSSKEVEVLFDIISKLKKQGTSLIYISHRLEEIFKIADRVTVLKDGKTVGEKKIEETNMNELIKMMVGRNVRTDVYDADRRLGKEIFRCEGITNYKVKNVSFSIKAGEIVGLYGLVGSGRTETARAIFGADPLFSGKIYIEGKEYKIKSPIVATRRSLSLIPEDRRLQGLGLQLNVKHNVNLASYKKISNFGFVSPKKERFVTVDLVKALSIKTPSINQKVSTLSGGNQQKVVVAKWLAANSKVFIMDEPTVGIDVGAKNEIYDLINKLAKEGGAVLFISSYMPELIAICDRILVMKGGEIAGEVKRQDFNEEKLLELAIKQ
ncbi:sugar ABC transporter ATP-binding protein [Mesoaciditoga lauensis]|uniref:sugar ABC transporter ATP-binding protein n=1 Tax=Mesoaciditoga lauensis TaxID=1495039 RepID=UPI0005682940|nr:sugar ABC transporter ATP-binding protein [Mesoaciditoga lauensis]